MIQTSAVDLRKALAAAHKLAQAGVLFVPMPVADKAEQLRRVAEAGERLEQMAISAEATPPAAVPVQDGAEIVGPLDEQSLVARLAGKSNVKG